MPYILECNSIFILFRIGFIFLVKSKGIVGTMGLDYFSGYKLILQMYHRFVLEDQFEVEVRSGVVDVNLYI